MKLNTVLYLVILCLSSCMGFSSKEKIIGNYFLVAADVDEQMCLSYCEPDKNGCVTIIDATVFGAGHNQDYIMAEQHPCVFSKAPNKSVTNYFILPINRKEKKWGDNFGLIGPLTLEQFQQKIRELGLGNIRFSTVYKNLE